MHIVCRWVDVCLCIWFASVVDTLSRFVCSSPSWPQLPGFSLLEGEGRK